MSTIATFYLKNDNALRVTVLDKDNAPDITATVKATTVDRSGTAVQTALPMVHDSGGTYEVILDETLYETGVYTARVTVVGTNGEDGFIKLRFAAQPRRA